MRKVLKWAAVAIIALAALYVVVGGLLFGQILGRILVVGTGTDLAAAGQPSEEPYDLAYRGDPKVAFGFAFEDATIVTDIGDAAAWFIPPAGPPRDTWAIFVHGIAGTREGGYRYLPILHETGFPTLMITYRNDAGAPRSAEGLYSFGLTEWPDLDAAVAYALENGAKHVILAGDSMGGGVVGQFLRHSSRADRVQALLMDAPALDFPAVTDWVGGRSGFPLPALVAWVGTLSFGLQHGIDMREAVVLPEVAAFPGPLFLVHGSSDRIVPVTISERLLTMRYGKTTFLRSHGDHLQSRKEFPELYDAALRTFLQTLP